LPALLVVLQQDETNHEGSSDESDTEPFGYEQLPQEYNEVEDDDDDVDAGYSEHQQQQEEGVNLTEGPNGYIFQAGKPEPLQLETTEDVNIPEGRFDIKPRKFTGTFIANNEN
jgi:hypothetical protein